MGGDGLSSRRRRIGRGGSQLKLSIPFTQVGDPSADDAILGEESTIISNQQVAKYQPCHCRLPLQAACQPECEGAQQAAARGAQGGGRQAKTKAEVGSQLL